MIEVSDDAFHHGEEVDNSAKRALEAAKRVGLKTNSISINRPSVGENSDRVKGEPVYTGGPKLRGRAIEKFVEGLPTRPWEEFSECPFEDLRNPGRVHIDSFGNVHLCQGLSMGNMWEVPLSDLANSYDPDQHPICGPLLKGGPAQLTKEYDVKHVNEYVDACHLCSMTCLSLMDRFSLYLAPKQVYGLED
jgi:hypothetical protein